MSPLAVDVLPPRNRSECPQTALHVAPHSFHIFYSKHLTARFAQQTNFIVDLEIIVPAFYRYRPRIVHHVALSQVIPCENLVQTFDDL
jgi:hypothetical protein